MNFSSDNAAGVCAPVMTALAEANRGRAMAYGADPWTEKAECLLKDLFETDLAMFPVATGTAANALALSQVTPPWGQVFCHRHAHIEEDEAGAPELFSGGAKLALLDGPDARFDAETLAAALAGAGFGVEHHPQPAVVSLTQLSERGAAYRIEEIAAICEVAHRHSLLVHMDGARFANALVGLNASAADMTWRAGIDILSFGATKNGAMAAEAVLFFQPARAEDFRFRRKRGGHLFSKMRFLSAQLVGYLENDAWLANARHANTMAGRLAEGLGALPGASLAHPVDGNELFIRLPETVVAALEEAGGLFHRWEAGPSPTVRLVTAFDSTEAEVDRFVELARAAAAGGG